MTETTAKPEAAKDAGLGGPPTLTPLIAVHDARRAVDWYVDALGAHRRGKLRVMPDGSVGHAEVGMGDAVLMISEGSSPVPVRPGGRTGGGRTFSHTIHAQVDDVDATVRRARERGAEVECEPENRPYGRVAVIVDPFGHRWMLSKPPGWVTRQRQGDVAYITMVVPDDERARQFYGAVLGWGLSPGSVPHAWNAECVQPRLGLMGAADQQPEVQLCYRVVDIEAAARRVAEHGGQAGLIERKPSGLLVECVDNQGARFQLWQPVD